MRQALNVCCWTMITAVYLLGQLCLSGSHLRTNAFILTFLSSSYVCFLYTHFSGSITLSVHFTLSLSPFVPLSLCLCMSFHLSLSAQFSLSFFHHSINCGDDGCLWSPEACESNTLNPKCCLELYAIKTTPTWYRNSHTWSLSKQRSVESEKAVEEDCRTYVWCS